MIVKVNGCIDIDELDKSLTFGFDRRDKEDFSKGMASFLEIPEREAIGEVAKVEDFGDALGVGSVIVRGIRLIPAARLGRCGRASIAASHRAARGREVALILSIARTS